MGRSGARSVRSRGHNTATFFKRDGGWWYRKATWDQLWDRPLHEGTPRLDLAALRERFGRNHWASR